MASLTRCVRLGSAARCGPALERAFRQKKVPSGKKRNKQSGKEFTKQAMLLRPTPIPKRSKEQLEADYEIVKEYRREYTNFMYRMRADEAMRLRMKKAAINALPPKLKEMALVEDTSPFPPYPFFTETPPIAGYVHKSDK